TLLQFMHPLFTLALAAWVLGERLERGVLVGAPIAVLGLLAIVRPASLFGGASAELDPCATARARASIRSQSCSRFRSSPRCSPRRSRSATRSGRPQPSGPTCVPPD